MREFNLFNNQPFVLVNSGIRYNVHGEKKTETYGITYLLETPAGNWIVANGIRHFSTTYNKEIHGDWAHGHYFMEKKQKAVEYFLELK